MDKSELFYPYTRIFRLPELDWFAKINRMPLHDMLIRLRDAGLDSIPGGGAEILTDHARNKISPKKCYSR